MAGLAEQAGTTPAELKQDPRRFLTALKCHRKATAVRGASPLPPLEQFERWAERLRALSALFGDDEPRRYLTDRRQIDFEVIRQQNVGWGLNPRLQDVLTFPMVDSTGTLVAAKWRLPRKRAQMCAWPGEGRPWPLYPVPKDEAWILLVAGELDGLRGRSAGLPTCSVTLGAGTWRRDWTEALRGRFVVVLFDNDEGQQARERVAALRQAGVRSRRIDLRSLGVHARKADLSDYLNGGGSVRQLRRTALRRGSHD